MNARYVDTVACIHLRYRIVSPHPVSSSIEYTEPVIAINNALQREI